MLRRIARRVDGAGIVHYRRGVLVNPKAAPLALALLALLSSAGAACAQESQGKADETLATVDGKPITRADVETSVKDQLEALERELATKRWEIISGATDKMIEDRLLDAEAAARGVTKDELLASAQPAAVTDADVDAFYEQNKAQIPQGKEAVAAQIKQYLEQQRQQGARQTLIADLRQKHDVKVLLDPQRTEVAATGPAQGPENAPITIVEFSDFECPYCARINPTLEQVKAKYGDQVRLVFRQFPLSIHRSAQKAAEASLCAHDQGKFWELHDAMFQNQKELGVDQLKAKAAELGLEAAAFNECLDSGKHADAVQADFKAGAEAGVSGTPAMFINGRMISGAVPLERITDVIDDELRRKSGG
jgi:protein-disulfide isomerase